MLLGIDVGGTHTDAVLVSEDGIGASFKVPTDHDWLMASVTGVLEQMADALGPDGVQRVERVNLSTTLTTNAIVEGLSDEVGVLVSAGPGMDPHDFMIGPQFHVIPGAIDHRGEVTGKLDADALADAVRDCTAAGVDAFACVSKFCVRNPVHEQAMRDAVVAGVGGDAEAVITMGHQLGGRLNFPRRIATAYYNAAVWRLFATFADAVELALSDFGFTARVNILKADGGIMPLAAARKLPVESILSGPAASVMGTVALCDIALDSIILDIGGTTTDIAVFAGGEPLMEREGIDIGSYPTLVRALLTRSIGIGGDSAISVLGDDVRVGPRRYGPPVARGGKRVALMDCFNYVGKSAFGDVSASREAVDAFASERSMKGARVAEMAVAFAIKRIVSASREMVAELNGRPVYTIHELLEEARLVPQKVYVMGGPAEAFRMDLFRAFGLSVSVVPNHGVANAVGAALTRTTHAVELFADTQAGIMHIPAIGVRKYIEPSYSLDDGTRDATRALLNHLRDHRIPARDDAVEVTEALAFTMVEGVRAVGKNIRVTAQIKPGVLHKYRARYGGTA